MLKKKKKIGSFFFCKVIVIKVKIKGIIEEFKIFKKLKKKKERMIVKIVKIYLGLSLVLL